MGWVNRKQKPAASTARQPAQKGWVDRAPVHNPYGEINVPEKNAMEAFAAGAFNQADSWSDGAQKLYHQATGNDQALVDLGQERIFKDAANAQMEEQHPVATTVGEMVPYFAGGALAGGGIGANALMGAVTEGLNYEEKSSYMGSNAAAGAMFAASAAKIARMVGRYLTPTTLDPLGNVRAADDIGYPLTLGDRTGSTGIRYMEGALDSFPLTKSPYSNLTARQPVINRAALESLGAEGADHMSGESLKAAKQAISQRFDSVLKNQEFQLTDNFTRQLDSLEQAAGQGIFRDRAVSGPIANLKEILGPNMRLTGSKYSELRKEISSQAAKELTSDQGSRQLGIELNKIVGHLDDAVDGAMSPENLGVLQASRKQWRNYLAIMKGKSWNQDTGDIRPRSFGNALGKMDDNYRFGSHEPLYDAVRTANAFPIMESSRTAERLGVPAAVAVAGTNPALGIATAGGGMGAYGLANRAAKNPELMPGLLTRLLTPGAIQGAPAFAEVVREQGPGVINGDALNGIMQQVESWGSTGNRSKWERQRLEELMQQGLLDGAAQ